MKKKGRWIWSGEASQSRAILYFHGGACTTGSSYTHRSIAAHLASASGATAWSIDYRLAPEHTYPAALEDGVAARARADGVQASLDVLDAMCHYWTLYPGVIPMARRAVKVAGRFIAQHMETSEPALSKICFVANDMKKRLSSIILYTAALLLAVLSFTQKNGYALTSFQHAWNSGHIIAFWLWTYLMLTRWPNLATRSFRQQAVIGMVTVIVISFAMEGIQNVMGRTFSFYDIRKNIVGAAAALCFTIPGRKHLNKMIRTGIQIIVLAALLFELAPFARATVDDIIMFRQFPVLCSFETPFEKKRWRSNTTLRIDRNIKKEGRASLKVHPNFDVYTRATLFSLARNWTGFRFLELDLYNPLSKAIYIRLAVHDELFHRRGYQKKDRFVRSYTLPHGWNHIRIPIEEIRTAPSERKMQMADIKEIMVLVWQYGEYRAIYIDGLKLSRAP
jgi:hypothetical protein